MEYEQLRIRWSSQAWIFKWAKKESISTKTYKQTSPEKLSKIVLPEMSFRKCVTGAWFEVFFKCLSFTVVSKSNCNKNFPRFELCGVWWLAGVMFVKTGIQIGGNPDIFFARFYNAFEQTDIFHAQPSLNICDNSPASPRLRRASCIARPSDAG